MRVRDDERGQAIQVGFILLFGALVVALAGYQATAVPNQNSEVEFNHNQQVQGQLQELRNAIVSSVSRSTTVSVAVDLGTTYPSRIVAANPSPLAGTLETVGTADAGVNISIEGASAVEEEAEDCWGGGNKSFNSGLVTFTPNYNEYDEAPTTVYENTLLYNQFDGSNRSITGQTVVDGKQITLVLVNGSLRERQSTSYSVDVRPVSTGGTTQSRNTSRNVSITVPSCLSASEWQDLTSIPDEQYVSTDTANSSRRPDGLYNVALTLQEDVEFQFRLVKVGLGDGVTDTSPTYLSVKNPAKSSVAEDESTEVTLTVRDELGNPVSGVSVYGNVSDGSPPPSGSLIKSSRVSDSDSEVTFTYTANRSADSADDTIRFSLRNVTDWPASGAFIRGSAENATQSVSVTSSGSGSGMVRTQSTGRTRRLSQKSTVRTVQTAFVSWMLRSRRIRSCSRRPAPL